MFNLKSLWIFIFLSFSTSCKDLNLWEPKESISEVDAANVPKLWNWFSQYADDVAKWMRQAGLWKNELGVTRRIQSFLPSEKTAEFASILTKNKGQLPGLFAKLSALEGGQHKIATFPLTALPGGIPGKYEQAFKVLHEAMAGQGAGKISARRFTAQIVAKLAASERITQAQAYERHLTAFTFSEFGSLPEPLPNAFVDSNVFYGHLLEKKAPFLDVAFAPGGVLGPDSPNAIKAAHGVYVHIADFFEWSFLCKIHGCGKVSMAELMRYIARSSLAQTAVSTHKQKQSAIAAGKLEDAEQLQAKLQETIRILGFHADGREVLALSRGETVITHDKDLGVDIPVKLLDWASRTEFRDGTDLWGVYFDFQNLADDDFRNVAKLRAQFGNPPPGFLASSMNVASNPMFMGRPQVVATLFETIGWH